MGGAAVQRVSVWLQARTRDVLKLGPQPWKEKCGKKYSWFWEVIGGNDVVKVGQETFKEKACLPWGPILCISIQYRAACGARHMAHDGSHLIITCLAVLNG